MNSEESLSDMHQCLAIRCPKFPTNRTFELYSQRTLQVATLHCWRWCPEGDIRPEAILSRTFGSSGTASRRSVTLYKGPESSLLWLQNWRSYKYFYIIDKKYLMAPSLIVMVREAVVVSATHGCLYLLIHCTVGALRASIEYFDKIIRPNEIFSDWS